MRKLALSLSLALVLALAVSASVFAAAKISATGNTTFRTAIGENADGNWELMGSWRTQANLLLDAGSGDITGRFYYRIRTTGFVDMANTGEIGAGNNEVYEAYVNIKGAWIPGTQGVNIKVGRFATNLDNWVANFSRRDGVHVSDINLGSVKFDLYHGWITPTVDTRRTIAAVKGTGKLDIVTLTGVYAAFTDHEKVDDRTTADYVIAASVAPVSGVKADVEFASNGANDATAWKVKGELATVPNMTIRASAWNTDDNFRPEFRTLATQEHLTMNRKWTSGATRSGSTWGDPWIANGFSVGLSTTQAGLPFDVDFKSGKIFEANLPEPATNGVFAGDDMRVFSVGTTIAEIKTTVKHTTIGDRDPVIDVTASRAFAVAALGGNVNVAGTLRLINDDRNFGVDATWKAPNGITLGAHYANYDRVKDWNHNFSNDNLSEGIDIGKPGKADGFAITAGYQLNF